MLELIQAERSVCGRAVIPSAVVLQEHARLNSSLELTHRIASIADEKLANDIVILDMRDVVSYTDYFVICSGRNPRQTQTIAEELRERLKREGRARPRAPTATRAATGSCSTSSTSSCTCSLRRHAATTGSSRCGARSPARRTLADEHVFTLDEAEELLDGSIRELAGRMVEMAHVR